MLDRHDFSQSIVSVPLPAATAAVLDSLLPPRGRGTRGPGERGELADFERLPEEAVREWLGFAPLTLPSLVSLGFREYFAHGIGRDLVPRGSLGEGDREAVLVVYLPDDLPWRADLSVSEGRRRGLTVLSLSAGYGVPWKWGPMTTRRDPASGDSTAVTIGSTRVGVQHGTEVTRLAWTHRSHDADYNVTVMSGRPPRAAVEGLVQDRVSVGLG